MMIISPNVVKRNMFSWYSLMGISHLIMDGTTEHVDLSSNNWGKKGIPYTLGCKWGWRWGCGWWGVGLLLFMAHVNS